MPNQIKQTRDGSDSIVSEKFGEFYHSHHGSIQEAKHIFISNGIAQFTTKEISIFEMGFGSGLNAILTYYFAQKNHLKINYYTIEAYPLNIEIAKKLNYNNFLKKEDYQDVFLKMHTAAWNEQVEIAHYFNLYKILNKIEKENLIEKYSEQIDLIYYDAFAPSAQANLWEKDVLEKMYHILNKNGFLITYCAKGSFKRNLKSIGFQVNGLPGPIGKREITKATKV